jgi:DNA-binding IclR family transcriptional regulator
VSQMLSTLAEAGLVYKNRHGKYSLAVPLLSEFIQRQTSGELMPKALSA